MRQEEEEKKAEVHQFILKRDHRKKPQPPKSHVSPRSAASGSQSNGEKKLPSVSSSNYEGSNEQSREIDENDISHNSSFWAQREAPVMHEDLM